MNYSVTHSRSTPLKLDEGQSPKKDDYFSKSYTNVRALQS
jgi:hypothetical protein